MKMYDALDQRIYDVTLARREYETKHRIEIAVYEESMRKLNDMERVLEILKKLELEELEKRKLIEVENQKLKELIYRFQEQGGEFNE